MKLADVDSVAGIPLEEAIFAYGEIADPKNHRVSFQILRLYKAIGPPESFDPNKPRWLKYVDDQVEAERIVVEKLANGIIRAKGIVRGASPDQPPVWVHPDRWRIMKPDFETSSAESPGLAIDGILVFESASEKKPEVRYGQKLSKAKQYIDQHRDELLPLGVNEQARRIAAAVGCAESLAKRAIKDERSQGGQLSGHK